MEEVHRINAILEKNRTILQRHFTKNETTISKLVLMCEGFVSDYHTHVISPIDLPLAYKFCYEFGFRDMENGNYELVRCDNN